MGGHRPFGVYCRPNCECREHVYLDVPAILCSFDDTRCKCCFKHLWKECKNVDPHMILQSGPMSLTEFLSGGWIDICSLQQLFTVRDGCAPTLNQ